MIAIVGGGITGLALARELTLRDQECVVLEAQPEPGGVIRSARVAGHLLDWGPQRARLTVRLAALVEELGIQDKLVVAPRGLELFVYHRGKLRPVPFSIGRFVGSDIVSWRGKARAAIEPLTARARDDERVAELFIRKFGHELYENLLGPLYGGLYASDPRDMVVGLSLGHVLREFGVGRSLVLTLMRRGGRLRPPPACSFTDGMQTLPRALADSLGERVRLGCPVRAIQAEGGGWQVQLDEGIVQAEHVVVTTPAPATAELLRNAAPEAADRIASLGYNPLAVVHLRAQTSLRGMGFQVSLGEGLALKGVTFNDSLFGSTGGDSAREDLYTAYLGGATHAEVVQRDNEALGALASNEFRRCTGFEAQPVSVVHESMPAWDRSWTALTGMRLPPGLHVAANWETRPGLPGRFARARALAESLAGGPASSGVPIA